MLLKPGLENNCLDVLPNWTGCWVWGVLVMLAIMGWPGVLMLVMAWAMVSMEARPRLLAAAAGLWPPPAARGLGKEAGAGVDTEEGTGARVEITGTDPNMVTWKTGTFTFRESLLFLRCKYNVDR